APLARSSLDEWAGGAPPRVARVRVGVGAERHEVVHREQLRSRARRHGTQHLPDARCVHRTQVVDRAAAWSYAGGARQPEARTASAASCARVVMPSLAYTCVRCVFTVGTAMITFSAPSLFVPPAATRSTTGRSVGVSDSQPCFGRRRSPRPRWA